MPLLRKYTLFVKDVNLGLYIVFGSKDFGGKEFEGMGSKCGCTESTNWEKRGKGGGKVGGNISCQGPPFPDLSISKGKQLKITR